MSEELSLEELASRTGEPGKRLRRWQSQGLIGAADREQFRREDVEKARLVQLALRRGITLEALSRANMAQDGLLDHYLEHLFPAGVGPTYSLAEAAETLGIDIDLLRRIRQAPGLGEPGETVYEEDIEAVSNVWHALDAGLPEEALLQALKVYGDAMGRVADTETRLVHFYVHDRLKAAGVSGLDLIKMTDAAIERLRPLGEAALMYLHRKAVDRATREDMILHLAEDAGLLETAEAPAQLRVAIAFVDLSSFTPLAAAMGDVAAAQVVQRFSDLVREGANRWEGRVIKQIGDAFMLVFPEARPAVACALDIESWTAKEPQFPAVRAGIHCGSVLYREGDYVGSNVNIASRLAGEAERHQVLVSADVRKQAAGLPGVEFVRLGKRRLKGLTQELELFQVRAAAAPETEKVVDPVCGMELSAAEVAARLALEGRERAFCSEACLRRFVASPELYAV